MNTQINSLRSKMIAVFMACMVFAMTLAPTSSVLAGPIDGGPDRIAFVSTVLPTAE